jgi:uncharacterized protein (DUF1810 family)
MQLKLNRFIEAQEKTYETVFSEIELGLKRSHWMWYTFPQFIGLGYSQMSKKYAIQSIEEAEEYLKHPVLGTRLKQITKELLKLHKNDAYSIFGSPDNVKLKSCMTLFSLVDRSDEQSFLKVLEKYFKSQADSKTFHLISHKPLI